ncbi:hypothetical protein SCHPADRAFT_928217 [Schizopora paradoxa]|uniref:Uncharacterized protein n=1 Tax=Schizopora paradoxa TaxID=27342 RepID=A0A0H2SAG5_9AGAM|nr:hypothetical protein SCHPADRAFT_928217 [Schizopora paradoxa]
MFVLLSMLWIPSLGCRRVKEGRVEGILKVKGVEIRSICRLRGPSTRAMEAQNPSNVSSLPPPQLVHKTHPCGFLTATSSSRRTRDSSAFTGAFLRCSQQSSRISSTSPLFSTAMLRERTQESAGDGRGWGGDAGGAYGGRPLVVLGGHKGEDVSHLLRVIMHDSASQYYDRDDDSTPLGTIIVLLLLSTKYDIPYFRSEVIKHLFRHYPTMLFEFDAVYVNERDLFGRKHVEFHFDLLRAGLKAFVDILLPGLYYACTAIPISAIFDEEAHTLELATLKVLGRTKARGSYSDAPPLNLRGRVHRFSRVNVSGCWRRYAVQN